MKEEENKFEADRKRNDETAWEIGEDVHYEQVYHLTQYITLGNSPRTTNFTSDQHFVSVASQ